MTDVGSFTIAQLLQESPPPAPLPQGWVLKESRSQPGTYYYYHQETGVSKWEPPVISQYRPGRLLEENESANVAPQSLERTDQEDREEEDRENTDSKIGEDVTASSGHKTDRASGKRGHGSSDAASPHKKSRKSGEPKEVRVLHILKKHIDSRRPSSWRNAHITITKEQALEELQGLHEILQDEASNSLEDLQATFKDIARTESDCSSAKRGGDLGYFGRKKMQPGFEQSAFGLEIGELSGIVETNSGLHILLRIG